MTKKPLTVIGLAIALGMTLTAGGCWSEGPEDRIQPQTEDSTFSAHDFQEVPIKLSDGRTVLCIVNLYGGRDTECDWNRAR